MPAKPASAMRSTSAARSRRGSKLAAPKNTGTVARGRISARAKLITSSLHSRKREHRGDRRLADAAHPPGAEGEQEVGAAAHRRLRRHAGADRRADQEVPAVAGRHRELVAQAGQRIAHGTSLSIARRRCQTRSGIGWARPCVWFHRWPTRFSPSSVVSKKTAFTGEATRGMS